MACDTPVICPNASAMPEAAGSAALLFDPHNTAELVNHIESVLHNPNQAATMRQQGHEQVKKFSWADTGQKTAEASQLALSRKSA